jgi:hypothetical protein
LERSPHVLLGGFNPGLPFYQSGDHLFQAIETRLCTSLCRGELN